MMEVATMEDKIFDQFVIGDKFLVTVRDTVRYIIKCNMRSRETVKDDGSNEVSDNEAKNSHYKKTRIKSRERFPFQKLKMSLSDNILSAT